MALLDTLFGKKNSNDPIAAQVMPVLPSEIYETATMEFQDIIAPSSLEISPRSLKL